MIDINPDDTVAAIQYVPLAEPPCVLAEIRGDGRVVVDWPAITEAAKDEVRGGLARVLLAVRDGTWVRA